MRAPILLVGLPAAAVAPAEAGGGARYIVQYSADADVAAEAAAHRSQGMGVGRTFSQALRGAVVTATPAQAAALSRSARIASVELDARISISGTSISETQQPAPWGLDRVDQRPLPLSGSCTWMASGAGVSAYVVDTGVLASHTEFSGRVKAGWTAVADGRGSGDCNGHGTHVAGTVAGTTYGVAKSAAIVPVRVLDCNGSGYNSDVVAGLDWIAANHAAGTPAVVNMSLGGAASSAVDSALQGVINDGVTAVVAAGNSAVDACGTSPARLPAAVTVAATGRTPGANSTAVPVGSNVTATFSTAIQGLSSSTFVLRNSAGAVTTAAVSYNATTRTATLNPASNLASDGTFTATLVGGTTAIRDAAGTPLATTSWTFLTGPAPTVTSFSPGSNALLVKRANSVTVTFSEAAQGVGTATFTLKNAATGALVTAAVFRNGSTNQWILDPQVTLSAKTKYTVTVIGGAAGVRDVAGNQLATKTWQFTTGSF